MYNPSKQAMVSHGRKTTYGGRRQTINAARDTTEEPESMKVLISSQNGDKLSRELNCRYQKMSQTSHRRYIERRSASFMVELPVTEEKRETLSESRNSPISIAEGRSLNGKLACAKHSKYRCYLTLL
jgi:hypothetical protein